MAIANIVRTSLGPLGLDKMMVDDIGVRRLMCVRQWTRKSHSIRM
jgi:hypothetical protein